jgi:hypothetical protein
MSFRPDSPLNRLVILWPGVPITMCALGFVLAVIEISQTHSSSFAALAIAMGCGLAFSIGLLFHSFFIEWIEVTVTGEGIAPGRTSRDRGRRSGAETKPGVVSRGHLREPVRRRREADSSVGSR